jgi:hypothetical protein
VVAEVWSCSVLKGCLVNSSMCLGGPFIAPRDLVAVGALFEKSWLPSLCGCTGHCTMQQSTDSFKGCCCRIIHCGREDALRLVAVLAVSAPRRCCSGYKTSLHPVMTYTIFSSAHNSTNSARSSPPDVGEHCAVPCLTIHAMQVFVS